MDGPGIALVISGARKFSTETPVGHLYILSFVGLWCSFAALFIRIIWGYFRYPLTEAQEKTPEDKGFWDKYNRSARGRNEMNVLLMKDLGSYFSGRTGMVHGWLMILFLCLTVFFGIWMLAERKALLQRHDNISVDTTV